MQYSAAITAQSIRPSDGEPVRLAVSAPDDYAAARQAADLAASLIYGEGAMSSYLERTGDGSFRAVIGVYEFEDGWGRTSGATINIKLSPAAPAPARKPAGRSVTPSHVYERAEVQARAQRLKR